jgi:hypothetical protein
VVCGGFYGGEEMDFLMFETEIEMDSMEVEGRNWTEGILESCCGLGWSFPGWSGWICVWCVEDSIEVKR